MVRVLLVILIFILFAVNGYFFFQFLKLQTSIESLIGEYTNFQLKGDDLKLKLKKLSVLNNTLNKVKTQPRKSVVDFIAAKSKELQISFVQYSEKEDKIEKSEEGQKSKMYVFKVYQFLYNGIEISKLILLLSACEREFPGIKVKMIDLVMKDKKVIERVTVEFVKVTSIP